MSLKERGKRKRPGALSASACRKCGQSLQSLGAEEGTEGLCGGCFADDFTREFGDGGKGASAHPPIPRLVFLDSPPDLTDAGAVYSAAEPSPPSARDAAVASLMPCGVPHPAPAEIALYGSVGASALIRSDRFPLVARARRGPVEKK